MHALLALLPAVTALVQATDAVPASGPQLFRNPSISRTQVVFEYANDLWIAPRSGGSASRLTTGLGAETNPIFSPKFGTGNGSPKLSRDLNITDLAAAGTTVTLTVEPFPGTTPPTLSVASMTLTLSASGLRGETQGYIVAKSDASPVAMRIPYLYATEGSAPAAITLLEAPTAPTAAAPTTFGVRVLDGVGLALSSPKLSVQVVKGTGTVLSADPNPDVPNTYSVSLQLSTGEVVVRFTAGTATRDLTLQVQ